ncbi:hypothetical protein Goari_023257 [Gossypium aridum]|uniref:DUF4283 domain-containing protein n=1 Tax=Gossypium aridum TaxID=34290 RepID=A0A7J8X2F5_GOSAI|nr:hypothetical protein [Gossypium aridum]
MDCTQGVSQSYFKDTLLNGSQGFGDKSPWFDDDIELLDSDLKGVLLMKSRLLTFLLGKEDWFQRFYEYIFMLWKLSQNFQLMDTENDYFLVKFQPAVDYTKALSGDPCVIFEHSLTFQPWE